MTTTRASLQHRPFYPWLLAIYPVLFLFSYNLNGVFVREVLAALGAALLGASALVGIAALATRSLYRAAALAALVILAFFSYGHVYNLTGARVGTEVWLAAAYALIVTGGIAGLLRVRAETLRRAAPAANLISAALVVMVLFPIASFYVRGATQTARASQAFEPHPRLADGPERPDIYYIILDGYSSNEHLLRDYGYDNSAFTEGLEARGFFVAPESKTNYGVTLVSMGSALNMRYIEPRDRQLARGFPSDEEYFRRLVANNLTAHELQQRGYSYIFVMSGFVSPSTIADLNIDFTRDGPITLSSADLPDTSASYQRPFFPLLLRTTMLHPLAREAEAVEEEEPDASDETYKFWNPHRALMTWEQAEQIAQRPEATFAVVHIIKPHEPITFDREGNIIPYVSYRETPYPRLRRAFFDQLEFVNARTLAMIDAILAQSGTPPVIIIQGDHGSHLGKSESLDGRRTNFEILNAYRFPGREQCVQDPAIVPVNTFRVLFNCYFGADYPLLEARHFAMPDDYNDLFYYEAIDLATWEAERPTPPRP